MSATAIEWKDQVDTRLDDLIALRRDFHRHPELSFEEHRTAEIIAERLHRAGLEVRTGVARTGVVGVLRGDQPGRTIAWRADIDALPLNERLDAPFTSGTEGVMHACGHDGHTAVAIELAEILAAHRAAVPGTAVFIFQPAEEIIAGARPMIEAGVLNDPLVQEIYGLHFMSTIPVGRVQALAGPTLASCDYFSVEVRGQGGHGAMPHLSIDPMTAAANILVGMQTLIAREVPAQDTAVLTVGQIVSGTKGNIIPDSAVMRGTLRTYEERVREQLTRRFGEYAEHIGRAYRAAATVRWEGGACPACVNHEAETTFVRRCAAAIVGGEAVEEGKPVMPSDDMALFLRERPGCYFRVGIQPTDGRPHPHHAPEFEMHEDGLRVGLRVGLEVMRCALRPGAR